MRQVSTTQTAANSDVRHVRDLRLDFFRGLALIAIFIDHIPNNFLSYVTIHSVAFSDAAEVFVFISGYAAALAYGRVFEKKGLRGAIVRIYHRVWQLYVAHIFIFMVFSAEVAYTIPNWGHSNAFGLSRLMSDPHLAIGQALLLRFQPNLLDILPLYITLLAVFPIALIALSYKPLVALVPSATLYILTLIFDWHLPSYPTGHLWFFNPLAWQFLFVLGAASAYTKVKGVEWLPKPALLRKFAVGVAGIAAIINVSWVLHSTAGFPAILSGSLQHYVADKADLDPLRLISFLALAMVVARFMNPTHPILRTLVGKWLIRCGQHSLYIFCFGILLSVFGAFLLERYDGGFPMQLFIDTSGILLMIGLAELVAWYKVEVRERPAINPTIKQPSPVQVTLYAPQGKNAWFVQGIDAQHDKSSNSNSNKKIAIGLSYPALAATDQLSLLPAAQVVPDRTG